MMLYPDAKIMIFAKAPDAGKSKTRLIPAMGEEGAAELHKRMAQYIIDNMLTAGIADIELYCYPDCQHAFFLRQPGLHNFTLHKQQGRHLGERMANAMMKALAQSNSLLKNLKSKDLTQRRQGAKKVKYRAGIESIRNRRAFRVCCRHTCTLLLDFLYFAPLRLCVRSFLPRLGVFQQAAKYAIIIGTDAPCLAPGYLLTAFEKLKSGTDVVIGPAEDGGYVLIGLSHDNPLLFENIDWGSERVLQQTLDRINKSNMSLHILDTQWDVDTVSDLAKLRNNHQLSFLLNNLETPHEPKTA